MTQLTAASRRHPGLAARTLALAALFTSELLLLTVWLDAANLNRAGGLTAWMNAWGSWTLRAIVAFAVIFFASGYLRARRAFQGLDARLHEAAFSWRWLAGHLAALVCLGFLSTALFRSPHASSSSNALAVAWIACGGAAIAMGLLAFVPPSHSAAFVRDTRAVLIWSAAAAIAACWMGRVSWKLWDPLSGITFWMVARLLTPFLHPLVLDPATRTIGSPQFNVQIDPTCSGFEGAGLMLVFGIGWLWLSRRDYRFPRALLVIPVTVAIVFCLNSVRITALILLGHAGAPSVALGGFHSQAGWIAFNVVALGTAVLSRRIPWIAHQRTASATPASSGNPTASYLLPFLAILAAGMLTRAASAGFEWFYPLRFFAAAVVLIWNRTHYRRLNWRFGWEGPAIGAAVFVMWIALDRLHPGAASPAMAAGLAALSPPFRLAWIVLRTAAAVVTVPIAEELAFRGFLLRRLVSADFEAVPWKHLSILAYAGSSLAFGMLHGSRCIAGTAAGLLYALAVRRRGRFGDAAIAHAVTNALLAGWVLLTGQFGFW